MKSNEAIAPADIWMPSKQQRIFRGLLDAFSYPGRIADCAVEGEPAWLAVLAALVDGETTLADPQQLLSAASWSKLEARRAAPEIAAFVLAEGGRTPELAPNLGTLEAPEGGTTLLLRVEKLHRDASGGMCLRLTGPGIRHALAIGVDGLHRDWIDARNGWVSGFPLGVDMVLCDARRFVALPRTTHIEIGVAA